MSPNPDPTPTDGAGDSKPVPGDDAKKKESRDHRRVEKYVARGRWFAAFAAVLLNRPLRKAGGRTLLGMRIGGARGMGFIGEELTQIIGVGWTLVEIRWVGLVLMNLFLYWAFPVWGPLHVLVNFIAFLVLEHFSNAWMLQRVITMITVKLGAGFAQKLDKSSWGAFWKSIFSALGESGSDVGYETYDIVRKIANEQHYYAVACFICAFGMFGATQMAWASIPAASIAAYILWKITTAGGNNKSADGAHVVTKAEYNTIKRQRDEAGKIVWKDGMGRKFALPWFQSKLQLGMAGLIAAILVGSWTAAFIYRNDTDHDGLSNYDEMIYHTNPLVADTDHDGTSDGDEVRMGTNPLVAFDKDPKAARIANNTQWERTMDVSMRLRADSLRVIQRIREDSLRTVEMSGVRATKGVDGDSVTVCTDSLKTAGVVSTDCGPDGPAPGPWNGSQVAQVRSHRMPELDFERSMPGRFVAGLTNMRIFGYGFAQTYFGTLALGLIAILLAIKGAKWPWYASLLMYLVLIWAFPNITGLFFSIGFFIISAVYVISHGIALVQLSSTRRMGWLPIMTAMSFAFGIWSLHTMWNMPLNIAIVFATLGLVLTVIITTDRLKAIPAAAD